MSDWTFGITLTLVGAVGTLLSLGLLSLLTTGLKRMFPLTSDPQDQKH